MNIFTPINDALERFGDATIEFPYKMFLNSSYESATIFERRKLVVIGALPAMGKTSLILSIAKEIAVEKDIPIAIISTNQSTSYLAMRLLSIVCGFDVSRMYYNSQTEFDKKVDLIEEGNKILNCAPIYLQTICGNMDGMLSDIKSLVAEKEIKYVFVENINDLYCFGDRHFETKEDAEFVIVRKLKLFAQELNICIIAAYSLSRRIGQRRKEPILKDFPLGKEIMHYADTAMLLYRPEYDRIIEDKQGNGLRGKAYLTIFNNYQKSEISLKFENFTRFTTLKGDFPYLAQYSANAVTGKLAKESYKAILEENPAIALLESKLDLELI